MKLAKISDLFDVKYGVNLELVNLEECLKNDLDSINFVSRTEKNNGISAYVERNFDIEPNPARTISVAGGGSVLATFYQHEEYYSGRDLYVLIPKKEYTELEMLYFVYCIRLNKYRYNYGRQANKTLKDIEIPESMPVEWQKIDLDKFKPNANPLIDKKMELNIDSWKSFNLIDLFNITLGKPIHRDTLEATNSGITAYITRKSSDNGVEKFLEHDYDYGLEMAKCITIGAEGFKSYFQPVDFITGNKINILRHKKLNIFNALFIVPILDLEITKKFNYGRGVTKERLTKLVIKLPATNDGQPDWQWMEDCIKSLPYSSSL